MGRKICPETKVKRKWGLVDLDKPWEYKPWIHFREMSSGNGRKHVFPDIKYPQRNIYLFSDLEKAVYNMLRSNTHVIELFEQFPLDLSTTVLLSKKYDIPHPRIPDTKELNIMTTDFVAVVNLDGNLKIKAYSVKYYKDLKDARVLEKLWLEKEFWATYGVSWEVITEEDIK